MSRRRPHAEPAPPAYEPAPSYLAPAAYEAAAWERSGGRPGPGGVWRGRRPAEAAAPAGRPVAWSESPLDRPRRVARCPAVDPPVPFHVTGPRRPPRRRRVRWPTPVADAWRRGRRSSG